MIDATPLLRAYARWRLGRLAREQGPQAQETLLLDLVRRAAATRFGRDHGFAAIRTVGDFQARVPLRRYEDFWRDYWQPSFPRLADCTWPGRIPYFALTSGTTTGVTKYIPCSREMVRANTFAAADILVHHVANRPQSRVFGGKGFMLGGSTDLKAEAPGVFSGDLSGIAVNEIPRLARGRYFPPRDLALIADWEEKLSVLAPRSLDEDIRALSGTPSWLLVFFDRLAELRPGADQRLVRFYPHLELLVHGGVNFAPYRHRFEALLEGGHAELREAYAASEGFVAVADRGADDGMRLLLDNGLFYEFVPVAELSHERPTRHWLADAELDLEYALVLTSCAGAWGYILGDTVRLVSKAPPRLVVTGRTSYTLSAFGEHLIDAEIERAVAAGAEAIGASVTDYSVGALFPERAGELGGHLYVVEFDALPPTGRLAAFAAELDRVLAALNADYKAHRAGGHGLAAPRVVAAGPGSFAAWMKRRGKLGGQHKVPRIISDTKLFADLRDFVGRA